MCFNKAGRGPGVLVGPGRSLGPSGQGSLRNPSKLREIYVFNIFKNIFLLFCRASNPIIVKGWLHFGALVGYPLCAIVWLHFLIQFLIRKPILFWWHFFQKLKISCLCTPSFILCSSCLILCTSCFLKFPHISCSFLLVPSLFSLKSQNSAFWTLVIHIFWVTLNSVILGRLSIFLP